MVRSDTPEAKRTETMQKLVPSSPIWALVRTIVSRAYRIRLKVWMPGSLARSQDSIIGKIAAVLRLFRQRLLTSG